MARSALDRLLDLNELRTQDRPGEGTMVVNAPAERSVGTGSGSKRPTPLSETTSVLSPNTDTMSEKEEPTIEEYMAALLARSNRSGSSLSETLWRPASSAAQKVVSPPARQPVSPPVEAAGLAPVPECRTAFSELRELANISARSTFNAHLARQLVLEMHGKRLVAIVAMLASFALLGLTTSLRSPAYLAAVVAVFTACAWSVEYLSLARALSRVCAESDSADCSDD